MTQIKITVLVENAAGKRDLLAEHGLSFLIGSGRNKVLFDTGQGLALRHNTATLNVDLKAINAVVLSHGHYDHTGGLTFALNRMNCPRLYVHPEAFSLKYARNPDGSAREVGMTAGNKITAGELAEIVLTDERTEIVDGLFLTGPVPRITDFEDTGGAFFKDQECRNPDELPDDQAAFMETKNGTVVILGCAHSGVINTLRYIQTLTHNRPIHTVIGGMHLLHASPERMDQTVAELRRLNIQRLIPCHCTGFAAMVRLWKEFPGKCETCPSGTVIQIED
ncbi:MAG TPA: MBL fold metallo-hydrolase [Pontiellaceae bacterium]|nr:MBL fold metallo-hydrolase [Pontiellaceae bacterium]HPR82576.1 MBL fold metallo-hydrolase [Pontiellaceae bacterium]